MIIATAGHVDHGKTLLVKALTGVDTDRLPEEKSRGLTIDLGFAYRDLGDGAITGFIDVPGHERFIRTMVAGVSGIDMVLFIIAADDGPMPQTAEHLAILDLLGVSSGVVALTKIDRVSEVRVAEVEAQCHALLAPTALSGSAVIPVSALTGAGVEALRNALLEHARGVAPRDQSGNFRLAIDRSFLLKGAGRVVTGTVFSGRVQLNESVFHVPGGGELRVRGIHAQNREAAAAAPGERCALNLSGAGLRDAELHRGDWIVGPDAAFSSRRLDAEIRVLASEDRMLANRTPVHVHIGAADVTGRVVTLDGRAVPVGESAPAQLLLDREIHCVRGDSIVLRDQSARRTIGGGVVIDPLPDIRGRRRAERLAYLEGMRAPEIGAALQSALASQPRGVDLVRFARSWNLTSDELDQLLAQQAPVVVDLDGRASGFAPARWQEMLSWLPPALQACHEDAPDRAGANLADMARKLPERVAPALLSMLADELIASAQIERTGAALRLPGHSARRSAADEALWRRVEKLLDVSDLKVPVVHDLAEPLRMNVKLLDAFLQRSVQRGDVVRISDKRYYLPAAVERMQAMVLEVARGRPDGVFSVADFRDHSGMGRNAVVEVLEYFDRLGLTRREGQVRKLLRMAH